AQIRPETPAALSLARSVAKAAHATPERYRVRLPGAGPTPDVVDSPADRGEIIEQLALVLAARLDPHDEAAKRRGAAPREDRRGEPAPGRGRPRESRLGLVHAPVIWLWLDTLRDLGDAGVARLREVVSNTTVDAAVRGYALARLPYFERGDFAATLVGSRIE